MMGDQVLEQEKISAELQKTRLAGKVIMLHDPDLSAGSW